MTKSQFAFPQDPSSTYEMGPADPTASNAWQVAVNGVVVPGVETAEFYNPGMDLRYAYGMTPEGYPKVVMREPGGGGSIIVPHAYIKRPSGLAVPEGAGAVDVKDLHIGGVMQHRQTIGEQALFHVPRGFLDPNGETHDEAAQREFGEEVGQRPLLQRFRPLNEAGSNPNSVFIDTTGTAPDGRPAGARFYSLGVHEDEIEEAEGDDGSTFHQFRQDIKDENRETAKEIASRIADEKERKRFLATAEGIVGSRFVPFQVATESRDMYTSTGVAKLIGRGVLPFVIEIDGKLVRY